MSSTKRVLKLPSITAPFMACFKFIYPSEKGTLGLAGAAPPLRTFTNINATATASLSFSIL